MATRLQTTIELRITHLETYGPFIKLYAQVDKDRVALYEKLLHSLKNFFFDINELDLKPLTVKDVEVGLICVAKFEDGAYYRAKIVNLDKLRNNMEVTVNFIDHGNTHSVKVQDIRLFSKLLKLLRTPHDNERVCQLRDSPPLTEEFFLTSIAPKTKDWDAFILEHLKSNLTNNDLKCSVYKLEGKRCVKFLQPEYEPSNFLHGSNKIIPVPLSNQEQVLKEINNKLQALSKPVANVNLPPPAMLMQQPPPRIPNLTQPPPGIRTASDMNLPPLSQMGIQHTRPMGGPVRPGLVRPHSTMQLANPSPSSSVNSQFASEILAPGISHPVFVTHVENGPHSFAIQLQVSLIASKVFFYVSYSFLV